MKSRYNATRDISTAQYIAEVMCARRAKHLGVDLPDRFWQLQGWKQFFVYQVTLVNRLMRKYGHLVTLSAIIKRVDRRVWSVNHYSVVPAIQEEIKRIKRKRTTRTLYIENQAGIGKTYNANTVLELLDELEA